MKKYINTIKISSFLLLLFPFLGLPESWEHIYVIILAFIIGTTIILLHHKSGLIKQEDKETSLQQYVQELKEKFREHNIDSHNKTTRISDVTINHD